MRDLIWFLKLAVLADRDSIRLESCESATNQRIPPRWWIPPKALRMESQWVILYSNVIKKEEVMCELLCS